MKLNTKLNHHLVYKLTLMLIILSLLSGGLTHVSQAKSQDLLEEYRDKAALQESGNASLLDREASFGIAWADPNGAHSQYDWPFTFDQMGHVIQSYQNYSSGTSAAYFHHGIDMIAPNGTQVFTRSGGQVVNIENYQPGNSLYWEVAILDDEGYVWQYHHIDRNTIPQAIFNKFNEWKANPATGGYVPPNTHIGDIVYWTVTSFGYRFNHIHLNIIAGGDVYIDPLEFHVPLEDNQPPEIQAIGLLNGNTIVSGSAASSGSYGLYVRARDLFKSNVYYLPPYKTEFSVDGGAWTTVWEFHDLPGGSSDSKFLHDFFVPTYTKGNYTARDFYINLGFTPAGQRTFPQDPGEHNIQVRVWDYYGNSATDSFTWTVTSSLTDNGCNSGNGITRTFVITEDLLVTDVNLGVSITHARRGQVRVSLQSPTDATLTTIISNSSDTYANYDVWIDDSSTNPINDGNADNVAAPYFDRTAGPNPNGALDSFNGKPAYGEWTVFICDNTRGTTGTVNLVELEVIGLSNNNEPPFADPQSIITDEDTPVEITLTGYDPDGDPISFAVMSQPSYGSLSGTPPYLTYTPAKDYNGTDSLIFIVNDGIFDSELATVSITISAVNDAPVAESQSVSAQTNNPVAITLGGSDVDGDSLTFSVISGPDHGSLSGIAPDLIYSPHAGFSGEDAFTFVASDGYFESEITVVNITVTPPGPIQVFWDDFESDSGWVRNPSGIDAATSGVWERATPQRVTYNSYTTQLGTPVSGVYDLVTGSQAGSNAGDYDVDDGVTSIRSPKITLPANAELTLSFYYYLAHLNNANNQDYFRASIIGDSTHMLFEKLGAAAYVNAAWQLVSVDISQFSGQDVYILLEVADEGAGSLIEAAVDDVLIEGLILSVNNAPMADDQSIATDEDTPVEITLTGSDPDDDALNFTVTGQPSNGVLSGTAPELIYTPDEDFYGADGFTFTVGDGQLTSEPASVSITVNPVNDAPVANPQMVVTDEDASVEITLDGWDVDGDELTFIVTVGPLYGILSGDAPDLIYLPNPQFSGEDSFEFIITDGLLTSDSALVSITVNKTNRAPVADGQSVSTDEDTPLQIILTGIDPDGDSLLYTVIDFPTHGTLSGTAPELTCAPNENYYGEDSFTFTVDDGQLTSEPATVMITINPVNDVPVAFDQSITIDEDTAVEITLSGIDFDGDELTYTVVTNPLIGTLRGVAPDLIYTPNENYYGQDSFTFVADDGQLTSEPATISITVAPVNDMPIANSQTVATDEDTAVDIILSGFDVEGDMLTFSVLTQPANGTLSGTAPELIYSPNENYYGEDGFTFTVNDGQLTSEPATVNITVNPVNDVPVAFDQSIIVDEDSAVEITLSGIDFDGDELTYKVTSGPAHGGLTGTAPHLVYTPEDGYSGNDTFAFAVNDGIEESEQAIVSITIIKVNRPPIVYDQSLFTHEDVELMIELTGMDEDGDDLNFFILTEPARGSLSGEVPNIVYTPDENYYGSDSFTFYVNDGEGDSDPGTINITIEPVNDAPVADGQRVTIEQDSSITITLMGSDVDNEIISFSVVDEPEHGSLAGTAPDLIYTPDTGFSGDDRFTFIVSDGELESELATVTIVVTPSEPSTIFWDDFESELGWVRNPNLTDKATLGLWERGIPQGVTYNSYTTQLGTPVSGSYNLVTGRLAGSDAGSYDIDGGVTSIRSPLIQLPANRELSLSFHYYLAHLNNASSADYFRVKIIGDSTTTVFEKLASATNASAVWQQVNVDITSFAGQSVYIVIEAADEGSGSLVEAAVDDVLITAEKPNIPPVADSQSLSLEEDGQIPITLTGSDPEGKPLSFDLVENPQHGSITGILPNIIYSPDPNYYGFDSFSFTVNDGVFSSAPVLVDLEIAPVNDAPVADPQSITTQEGTGIEVVLSGSDIEGDLLTYAVVTQPMHGTLTGTAPNLLYKPEAGFTGNDMFTFKVYDGELDSGFATVDISVSPAGPVTAFFDDFETDQGWVRNPSRKDTATLGYWQRAIPQAVYYVGDKQLEAYSGSYDLVTGPLAGNEAGSYDLDGGLTSIRSPYIQLPTGADLTLSFQYYLAHYTNSSSADYFRVKIVGNKTQTVFEKLGSARNVNAVWQLVTKDISQFAGQTVYILIEAADTGTASLLEVAVDDVMIVVE